MVVTGKTSWLSELYKLDIRNFRTLFPCGREARPVPSKRKIGRSIIVEYDPPLRYQHQRLTQETAQTDHHIGKHSHHAPWASKHFFVCVLYSSMSQLPRITKHLRKALNLKDRNWNKKMNKRKFWRNRPCRGKKPSKAIDILIFSKR